jgi:hypothetical protein
MSMLSSGDHASTLSTALNSYLASGAPDGPGLYLTNGAFLYRVVRIVASDTGEMVELEDCYSLDVVRIPMPAFHERRLRVVIAAPAVDDLASCRSA